MNQTCDNVFTHPEELITMMGECPRVVDLSRYSLRLRC